MYITFDRFTKTTFDKLLLRCFSFLVPRPIETTVRKCILRNIWTALYSCLVDLTDVTLAFEDANSKLLDVVSGCLRLRFGPAEAWSRL